MAPGSSLPRSQQPAACPCPEHSNSLFTKSAGLYMPIMQVAVKNLQRTQSFVVFRFFIFMQYAEYLHLVLIMKLQKKKLFRQQ